MNQDAEAFIDQALSRLERAVDERDSDFRNVQLATISADGCPQLRTMVLRGFEQGSPPGLEVHSDTRAGKVRDIVAGRNHVSLLAWSGVEKLQIRFAGTATVHSDDKIAHDRWDDLSINSRKPYGLRADPGSAIADPVDQPHLPPDEQASHFAVVRITVASVDVLRLGSHGEQTRASRRFDGDGARWLGA